MKTIRFKSLSSGSCGNCYFIGIFGEDSGCECGVLVDAGVSPRRLKKELQCDGLGFDSFSGILITHDHFDHIRSLGSYCKHLGKDVWATPQLNRALSRHYSTGKYLSAVRRDLGTEWNTLAGGRILVKYFEVPHDASQTVGYALSLDGYGFVIMTDIGKMTDEAMEYALKASTVVIESNYDERMLLEGPYTRELKERIRGGRGHLSNDECAAAVKGFAHDGLKNVFLCHLSDHNNTPEIAHATTRKVLDPSVRLVPLPRQTASPLFILNPELKDSY